MEALLGTAISFDRAGRHLVVIEPEAIALVDLASSQATRVPVHGAVAATCFDDQLWVVAADGRWTRFDRSGHAIDHDVLPTGGTFIAAPCGAAAAAWIASPPILLLDDLGRVRRTDEPGADLILPLTGRRFVSIAGSRAGLPSRAIVQLPPGTVLGGTITSDAKSAILLIAHNHTRHLVGVSLASARVVLRQPVGTLVRVAGRAMRAAYRVDARTVRIVDLRAGRTLGEVVTETDIDDLAIDPDAHRCVVRDPDGGIHLHELAPPADGGSRPARSEPVVDVREPDRPQDQPTPTPAIAEVTRPANAPFAIGSLMALAPRARTAMIDVATARAQLDRELRGVSLLALAAIAAAWDSRRLGYGNEGRHPFELEVAAIVGMNQRHAGDHVEAAAEQLAVHERAIAADPAWRSSSSPIGMLAAELGLAARALDVLLVIAAPSLHGDIARLYGILANDHGRPAVDELLVEQILATRHDRHDLASELDPRAVLVRSGIVRVVAGKRRPFAALSIDPVVLARLRAVAPDLGDATQLRRSERALHELDIPRAVVEAALEALAVAREQPARIVVRGRAGSGRKTLLATLARHAERDLAVIDAAMLTRDARTWHDELAAALSRAHLAGAIPCLVNLDEVAFGEITGHAIAREALHRHVGPAAIACAPDAPPPVGPGHIAIDLPVLPESTRREVWAAALAAANVQVLDVDALAARYRIGPGVIRRAIAAAADARSSAEASTRCEAAIRQLRDARLGAFARRVDRLGSWSTLVLPPDILDSLRELVARVRYGRIVFEQWGMNRVMSTSRGLTALFQGPPGTGKTLVAGVIARELGLDLYQVDLSKVMSKWIGETERNLATIFDAAEDGQVVLLFDEADSLFAKRTEIRSSNDRYANLEVNYLLQRLDAFEGIAILTTNNGTSIDEAFKRRLSFRLSFPFPDEETREQLWRAHLPPELPIAGPLELDRLARKFQLSGGYIRNVCLRAAFLAAAEETAIAQHHLERAVTLEYAEFGKLSTGGAIG